MTRSPDTGLARPRVQAPARPAAGAPAEVDADRRVFDTVVRQLAKVVLPALKTVAVRVDARNAPALDWLVAHLQTFETSDDAEATAAQTLGRLAQLDSEAPHADHSGLVSLVDAGLARAEQTMRPLRHGELKVALVCLKAAWPAWLALSRRPVPGPATPPSIGRFLDARLVPAALARRRLIVALHTLRSACRDESPRLGADLELELSARLAQEYQLCDYAMICAEDRDAVIPVSDRLETFLETGYATRGDRFEERDVHRLDAAARRRFDLAEFARWVIGSTPQKDDEELAFLHMSVVRNLAVAAMIHADLMHWTVVTNPAAGRMDPEDVAMLRNLAIRGRKLADQINCLTTSDPESPAIAPLVAIFAAEAQRRLPQLERSGEWLAMPDTRAKYGPDEMGRLRASLDPVVRAVRPLVAALAGIVPEAAGTTAIDGGLERELEHVVQSALLTRPMEIDQLLDAAKAARADRVAGELARAADGAITSAPASKAASGKKSKPARKTKRVALPPRAESTGASELPVAALPETAAQRHLRAQHSMNLALGSANRDGRQTVHTETLETQAKDLADWLERAGDSLSRTDATRLSTDLDQMRAAIGWISFHFKTQRLKNAPTRELFEDAALQPRIEVLPGLDPRLLAPVSSSGKQREEGGGIIEVGLVLRPEPPPAGLPGPVLAQETVPFWLHVHVNANRAQMQTAHFKADKDRFLAHRTGPAGEKLPVHRGFITPVLAQAIMDRAGPP